MQYMLLIYSDPALRPRPGTPEMDRLMESYAKLGQKLRQDGAHVAGDALKPAATARTLRGTSGQTVVMDGPYADTREHLGGFYLIEAPDLDQALAYAAMIPTVDHGAVEVREMAGFAL